MEEGDTESRDHGWCDLGKLLPSLGISFFLWKCGVGLGHSKGPFSPDVQGCCAIISAVIGLSCVRKLLLKAFLISLKLCWATGAQSMASCSFKRGKWFPRAKKATIMKSGESAKGFNYEHISLHFSPRQQPQL